MSKDNRIQSLQIGLNILEIIAAQNEPLKFTEIQNLTSMTKSNLYKYLSTLHDFGYIQRNPDNTYSLGHKLIQLGNIAQDRSPLLETIIPHLRNISDHTGLTALLALPTENGPLVSYISSATYGINIGAQIGTNLPLYSSTGIVFASFENPLLKNWIEEEFSKVDENEKEAIMKELEETKNNFYTSKIEPLVTHVSSFSVPILNFNEELLGAITVVGYTEIVPSEHTHPISQMVINICKEVSTFYGYTESLKQK